MSWETFKSNDGTYRVNWEGITRIIRSSARAQAMVKFSEEVPAERHWIGPDLYSVNVDWDKVRNEIIVQTEMELRNFHAGARRSMQTELNRLAYLLERADDNHDKLQTMMHKAQEKTMKNVEVSIQRNEIVLRGLTVTRNLSADIIMVGATYLSGGMALAAVGTGSAMKSGFAYQDTGKTGTAVATLFTNLVFGVADVKVGAALENVASKIDRVALNIVWAKAKGLLEIPKNVIEGKQLNEAAAAGMVKAAAATPATAGIEELKSYLKALGLVNWAIPVEVALNSLEENAGESLAKAADKAPERKDPPKPVAPVHRSHQLMDAVIYERSIIEQSAVRKVAPPPRYQHHVGAR